MLDVGSVMTSLHGPDVIGHAIQVIVDIPVIKVSLNCTTTKQYHTQLGLG